jgi:hypothetical protein
MTLYIWEYRLLASRRKNLQSSDWSLASPDLQIASSFIGSDRLGVTVSLDASRVHLFIIMTRSKKTSKRARTAAETVSTVVPVPEPAQTPEVSVDAAFQQLQEQVVQLTRALGMMPEAAEERHVSGSLPAPTVKNLLYTREIRMFRRYVILIVGESVQASFPAFLGGWGGYGFWGSQLAF